MVTTTHTAHCYCTNCMVTTKMKIARRHVFHSCKRRLLLLLLLKGSIPLLLLLLLLLQWRRLQNGRDGLTSLHGSNWSHCCRPPLCSKGRIGLPPVKWLVSLHRTCKKDKRKKTDTSHSRHLNFLFFIIFIWFDFIFFEFYFFEMEKSTQCQWSHSRMSRSKPTAWFAGTIRSLWNMTMRVRVTVTVRGVPDPV
jgi:hypothetical protein